MERLSKDQIYASGQFLDGREFVVIMPLGKHISKAMRKMQICEDLGYDMTLFIMEQIVRVDGQEKDAEFYQTLMIDDYMQLINIVSALLTPNK